MGDMEKLLMQALRWRSRRSSSAMRSISFSANNARSLITLSPITTPLYFHSLRFIHRFCFLFVQFSHITERLRDPRSLQRGPFSALCRQPFPPHRDRNEPEGQPPVKRRLSSAVVRVEEEGELIQDDPAHAPKSVNTNGTSATNRISRFLFVDAGTMVSPTVYARRSLCYLINDIYQEALNDAVQTRMISPVWHIAFYLESVVLGGLGMENEAQVAIKEATTLESKRSSNAKQK
ncbi:hypothetical protein S83_065348 [Arachis hypogaea]